MVAVLSMAYGAFAGWTYNDAASQKYMDENVASGAWKLKITVIDSTAKTFRITGVQNIGTANTDLDLSDFGEWTLVEISGSAFSGKNTITSIKLPETSLTAIRGNAFQNCTSLTNVVPFLPDSVTTIESFAFTGCSQLTGKLRIGFGGETSFPANVYGNAQHFLNTKITELEVGPGISGIYGSCFSGCTSLCQITFVNPTISTIGGNAFQNCTSLTNIVPFLPDSLTSIGSFAFNGCSKLAGDLRIGFGGPTTLAKNTYNNAQNFNGCSKITSVTFGPGITSIGNDFTSCSSITNIEFFGENDVTIGGNAFGSCSSLATIVMRPYCSWANNSFAGTKNDYYGRILYLQSNGAWETFITGLGSAFTAWASAGNHTNTYNATFTDGLVPRGYATSASCGGKIKWFVPFRESAGAITLAVAGEPYNLGTVDPEYKNTGAAVTPPATCTVSQYGEREDVAYESIGYRIQSMGDEAWEDTGVGGSVRTFDFSVSEDGDYRVLWNWAVAGYALNLSETDPLVGSVTVSGSLVPATTLGREYFVTNAVVTLTATAGEGSRFECWYGDVPEGQEKENPLHLTMNGIKNITPYFERPWTYDSTSKKMTDGYWTLNTSGDASTLKITSVAIAPSAVGLLDLRKTMIDCSVSEIGGSAFSSKSILTEVRLRDTITAIRGNAFYGCSNLQTVTPFLPDSVTTLESFAFSNCSKLTGKLRIGFGGETSFPANTYGNAQHFLNTKITDLEVGPGISGIYGSCFSGCSSLTNITFVNPVITIIGGSAFSNCSALKTITPCLPDTLEELRDTAFNGCSALTMEVRLGFGRGADLLMPVNTYNNGYQFNNCSNLKVFRFGKRVKNLGNNTFSGCSKVEEMYFASKPTFESGALNGIPATARVFIGKSVVEWDEWVNTPGNVTPWDQCDQQAYFNKYGADAKKPVGRALVKGEPFAKDTWIIRYSDSLCTQLMLY